MSKLNSNKLRTKFASLRPRFGTRVWDLSAAVKAGILLLALSVVFDTFAGTVITSNLALNTAIINIDARADGSATSNPDQSLWYQPFNVNGAAQLLTYSVQAGTYQFRIIDPSDAAQMFPSLTSQQTSQIFTAWSFNTPWATDYLVFDGSAASNGTVPQLFDGAFSNTNGGSFLLYSDAADAYNAAISKGFYNLIRTSAAGGRDSTNDVTSYTFASATTLIFAVPDYALSDNQGGVSVLVSPTLTAVQTYITSVNLSGPNVMLTASNGQASQTYITLMSTNLALPFIQWKPVATNLLNAKGNFTISTVDPVNSTPGSRFYILKTSD